MSDQYYRFFPGDYLRDTGDLTLTEHGAYRILLDNYYMQESLTANRDRLYRMCRAFSEEERAAIDTIVTRFFQDTGHGNLINRKAEEEIARRKAFLQQQARKSRLAVEARRQPSWPEFIDPRVDPRVDLGLTLPSPSPSPSPSPKMDTPNGVSWSSGDDRFASFWSTYPRKVAKGVARKRWKKIKPTNGTVDLILSDIQARIASGEWDISRIEYIPHPATYLNQRRWEDETKGKHDPCAFLKNPDGTWKNEEEV